MKVLAEHILGRTIRTTGIAMHCDDPLAAARYVDNALQGSSRDKNAPPPPSAQFPNVGTQTATGNAAPLPPGTEVKLDGSISRRSSAHRPRRSAPCRTGSAMAPARSGIVIIDAEPTPPGPTRSRATSRQSRTKRRRSSSMSGTSFFPAASAYIASRARKRSPEPATIPGPRFQMKLWRQSPTR